MTPDQLALVTDLLAQADWSVRNGITFPWAAAIEIRDGLASLAAQGQAEATERECLDRLEADDRLRELSVHATLISVDEWTSPATDNPQYDEDRARDRERSALAVRQRQAEAAMREARARWQINRETSDHG